MALPGGQPKPLTANNTIINKKNKNIMLVYTVAIQKKNLSKYYK